MSNESNNESLFDTKLTSDPIPSPPAANAASNANAAAAAAADQGPALDQVLPEVQLNTALITFRVLVSTREAGIIIGKNGNCVAHVREKTGVKSGVSKVIIGCSDRILTVSGPVDSTAEALALFAQALLESPITHQQVYSFFPLKSLCPPPQPDQISLRLLIPHSQMGTLIGKQGSRIKALQENFDVKIVASKDFLADSTERVVEIQGTPANIESVLKLVARCLIEDWHGATGTVYYIPQPRRRHNDNYNNGGLSNNNHNSNNNNSNYYGGFPSNGSNNIGGGGPNSNRNSIQGRINPNQSSNSSSANDPNLPTITQVVGFQSDFVGCLIGKKGSRIQEIRKNSGAQISIAQEDDEEDQRAFTIVGNQFNVDKALSLLYQQIQREKQRRSAAQYDDEE